MMLWKLKKEINCSKTGFQGILGQQIGVENDLFAENVKLLSFKKICKSLKKMTTETPK